MNIHPIGFASAISATHSNFQDKIKQPQSYISTDSPSAASGIKDNSVNKKSPLKYIAGIAILGLAVYAAARLAKAGITEPKEEDIKYIKEIKEVAFKFGNFVNKEYGELRKIALEKINKIRVRFGKDEIIIDGTKTAVKDVQEGVKEQTEAVVETVKESVKEKSEAVAETVKEAVKEKAETVIEKAQEVVENVTK